MQNRYSPPAVWLKSLIENNLLGKIYMVNLTVSGTEMIIIIIQQIGEEQQN